MIEVERKFIVSPEELSRLLRGATPAKAEIHVDVYYDTKDFLLTRRSIWLRMRDGRWEIKIPIGKLAQKQKFTRYDEVEGEESVLKKLGEIFGAEPHGQSAQQFLKDHGCAPFASIATKRTKYKMEKLSIDVDETDYGYNIMEIEAMVEKESDIDEAYRSILALAERNGIAVAPVQARGKVIEYIRRTNPAHFKALEEAWGTVL